MSKHGPREPEALIKRAFEKFSRQGGTAVLGQPGIFRGDSFQLAIEQAPLAMRSALRLGCLIRSEAKTAYNMMLPFPRLGVGVGQIDYLPADGPISTGQGDAFRFSGGALDQAKEQRGTIRAQLGVSSQKALDVLCRLLDHLIWRWTPDQCEALEWALGGHKQKEIAKALGVSQPSVSRRLTASGFDDVSAACNWFATLAADKESCHGC